MNPAASPVADLAVLLARGYLRLAEKCRIWDDSGVGEAHQRLDSPRSRSTPVTHQETPRGREHAR
jgi:hypothetical protein